MSVDITIWKEDPALNKAIEGMSLVPSAPILNVGLMVATLMAAIKSGDARIDGLTIADIAGLAAALAGLAPAMEPISNVEIYNIVEGEE